MSTAGPHEDGTDGTDGTDGIADPDGPGTDVAAAPSRLRTVLALVIAAALVTAGVAAGFAWGSGLAGIGWNTTVSRCPDTFAAAASGRSSRLP